MVRKAKKKLKWIKNGARLCNNYQSCFIKGATQGYYKKGQTLMKKYLNGYALGALFILFALI